ncbi:Zinc finger MYM-type protein 2 [Dissostichus eleginoides]|uniref:Zinc finger MYM-type protein 2 n=1 Tax=Dissostichus eleginoides TaxID=100907 RepID=A0AAD9CED4_DISEL|nr:Zinc finger MYM-type protein 2 [Dissostichus eleginoides]
MNGICMTRSHRSLLCTTVLFYSLQLQVEKKFSFFKKLYALSAPEEELGDYDPHNYTEEGDEKHNFDLDAISIPDTPFDPELDLDLDFRFDTLASICMSSKRPCLQYKT